MILRTLSANLIQIKLMVTIWSVFACLNYAINPFVNLLILSSNLVWRKAFCHQNGKSKCLSNSKKNNNKQCIKNSRPVSLFPICSKIFERFISRYSHILQKGFKAGDSFNNPLLTITHEMFPSFDDNYEVRPVFLDI